MSIVVYVTDMLDVSSKLFGVNRNASYTMIAQSAVQRRVRWKKEYVKGRKEVRIWGARQGLCTVLDSVAFWSKLTILLGYFCFRQRVVRLYVNGYIVTLTTCAPSNVKFVSMCCGSALAPKGG